MGVAGPLLPLFGQQCDLHAQGRAGGLKSPFVLAEVDYMIMSRSGAQAGLVLLNDLAAGVYQVAEFTATDAERIADLARRYADVKLGIADAHTMTLTQPDRYGTRRTLTLDHRHFRAVKPPQGGVFTILPADL
jgi:uncharacterized protein